MSIAKIRRPLWKISLSLLIIILITSCSKNNTESAPTDTPYEPPPAQSGKWRKMLELTDTYLDFPENFVIGSKVYIINGSDFYKYDQPTNKWTKEPPFPVNQLNATSVAFQLDGKGYYGLGAYLNASNGSGSYNNQFWKFDPNSESWSRIKDFPLTAFTSAFGCSANGRGYVGSGLDSSGIRKQVIYEYDPSADTWQFKTNFLSSSSGRNFNVAFGIGDNCYLGSFPDGPQASAFDGFWQYNPALEAFNKKTDPPNKARISFSSSTKGYAYGNGLNSGNGNEFYEYDPVKDKWTGLEGIGIDGADSRCGFIINDKAYVLSGAAALGTYELWEYTF